MCGEFTLRIPPSHLSSTIYQTLTVPRYELQIGGTALEAEDKGRELESLNIAKETLTPT